jgi:hypothetical protein
MSISLASSSLSAIARVGAVCTAIPLLSLQQTFDTIPDSEYREHTEDRVFLTSNELKQAATLDILQKAAIHGNTIIGVSGFFTLNMASVRGIKAAHNAAEIDTIIMIDRSTRVEHFWTQMKGIIAESATSIEATSKVIELIEREKERYYKNEKQPPHFHADRYIEGLHDDIRSSQSWLSSEDQFTKIKRIFARGRFVFKRLDLLEPSSFLRFAVVLSSNGLQVDTLYISNVAEYVSRSPALLSKLAASVSFLIAPETLVVHTRPRQCITCSPLEQGVVKIESPMAKDLFIVATDQGDPCGAKDSFDTAENTSAPHLTTHRPRASSNPT